MKRKNIYFIDVDQIPELNKPFIPSSLKENARNLYCKMDNFYNKFQNREIKKKKLFNTFKKCKFSILLDGGSLPFATVFLENEEVKYEIIKNNLNKLNLTAEKNKAELLTIKYLLTPVYSKILDCYFSIYSNVDGFFHVLEQESPFNEDRVVFGCYDYSAADFKKIEKIEDTQKRFIPDDVMVHIFDNGIVIIE